MLAQNYKNIEIIISDNGSTNNTYHILKSYELKECRIQLSQNQGVLTDIL